MNYLEGPCIERTVLQTIGGFLQVAEKPSCYGLYWEALPGTDLCMNCLINKDCLRSFATERLPVLMAAHVTPQKIAKAIDAKGRYREEAVLVAMAFLEKFEASRKPEPSLPESLEVLEEIVEMPKQQGVKKKTPPKKTRVSALADRMNKLAKSKDSGRKKKSRRRRILASNPRKAGPVKRAKVPAKIPQELPVGVAMAQEVATDWKRRNQREKKRLPELGRLTPGTVLQVVHKGVPYKIGARLHCYRYEEMLYPTMYKVVEKITGKLAYPKQRKVAGKESSRPDGLRLLSNYSVKRFFGKLLFD